MLTKKPFKKGLTTGAGAYQAIGGGGFSGLGDVKSGATSYWGLRGYNAAYATGSNPAIDIVDQAGANQLTVNILTTGKLDVASINTWVTANSVSTIKIKKIYDQISTNHMSQATLGNMPVLSLTALSSLPGAIFTAASSQQLVTSGFPSFLGSTGASFSGILKTQTGLGGYWGWASGFNMFYTNGTNTGNIADDTVATFTLSDSAYHAVQASFNGASSSVYVDGASTTGLNTGATDKTGVAFVIGEVNGFFSNMQFFELAIYGNTILSGTEQANLNSNQHGSNGWSF